MAKLKFVAFLLFILISCKPTTELEKEFNCNTLKINNLKEYKDFKNNFTIKLPSNWKTSKYYSDFESTIYSADTVKDLTSTYILNASFNLGTLLIDAQLEQKTDSLIQVNSFQKLKSGKITFQNNPAFWYLVKGTKNGFPYQQFNLLVKNSSNTFFSAYSEVYGDEKIEERICESISLIENIEFLQ